MKKPLLQEVPQRRLLSELSRRFVRFAIWFFIVAPDVWVEDIGPTYQGIAGLAWALGLVGITACVLGIASFFYEALAMPLVGQVFAITIGTLFYIVGGLMAVYGLRGYGFRL